MLIRVAVVLPVALITLGLAPSASGLATFTPTRFDDPAPGACDPADCSLREAVLAANAAGGPDEIVLAAGTYVLSIPADGSPNDGMDGDLDVTDDVTIRGQGQTATVIDANGPVTGERAIHLDPISGGAAPTGTILDLTIRNGSGDFGMGIRFDGESSGSVTDVTLTGADGDDFGGGVFVDSNSGPVTVTRATITGNRVDSFGAGLMSQSGSAVTVVDSVVTGNINDNGFGSGLWHQGTGPFNVIRTTISGNTGQAFGSPFWTQGSGAVVLENSTVSGNQSDQYGGIRHQGTGSVTIRNSTVSGNRSEGDAGGISVSSGTVTLTNTTVTGNVADSDSNGSGDGGGIVRDGGTVTLQNTIVAGNSDPTSEPDCDGAITSGGHNLIGIVSAGCTFAPTTGDKTGTPAAPLDARLGPLANNGGPTQTHALLAGSPAIDAAGPGTPPTDQRGLPRVGPPDIGAYELSFCQKAVVNRIGTEGNDVLTGTNGSDGFLAFGGKDRIRALGGNDGVCAGPGKDRASGGGGKDRILGEGGKDTLKGGGGKDRLNGGPGRDTCIGQGGKDKAKACETKKSIP